MRFLDCHFVRISHGAVLDDQKPLFEQNNSDFQKEAIWRKTSVFEQIEH